MTFSVDILTNKKNLKSIWYQLYDNWENIYRR
jgi:hypothetical protein